MLKDITFGYFTEIEGCATEECAVEKARKRFWGEDENAVKLFKPGRPKTIYNVSIDSRIEPVVQRVEAKPKLPASGG